MSTLNSIPKIAITHGDINGISYEIILKSLADSRILELCTPVVYGSSKAASYFRKSLNLNDFNLNLIKSPENASQKRPNLINITENEIAIQSGESTQMAGEMSLLSLKMAVEALKKNQYEALVTAPINKKNIQTDSFKFAGHTDFLAQQWDVTNYMMMMVADSLKLGLITTHVPINKVTESLTVEKVFNKIQMMDKSLTVDFAFNKPRIAVLAVNPHAGDHGIIGTADDEIMIPAINKAFDQGIAVFGPFPADGFFGSGQFRKFDGVLAAYHDQGLIPFKLLSFEEGVNYTAGLPIVRTSPAHGTAYEIAGKDCASIHSFRNALYLACDILKNRKQYKQLTSNPLK